MTKVSTSSSVLQKNRKGIEVKANTDQKNQRFAGWNSWESLWYTRDRWHVQRWGQSCSAWLPLISFAERIIQLHQLRKIIQILERGSYYLTAWSYPSIKLSWGPSDSRRDRSTCSEHCDPLEVYLSWWTVWEAWKYWLQFCRVSLNSRISSVLVKTKKNQTSKMYIQSTQANETGYISVVTRVWGCKNSPQILFLNSLPV